MRLWNVEHVNIIETLTESGLATMRTASITDWKPDIMMNVWIGVRGNDSTLFI